MIDSKNQFFLNEFVKEISTKEDLMVFLEEINLTQRLIFKKINVLLSEKTEGLVSKNFIKKLQELEEKKIISKTPEENRIFFEKLKKDIQSFSQITITISFRPKKNFIDKISSWLEKETGQKIILDFVFNPDIVGGTIMEYQGKQINLSLAEKIEELDSVQG